MELSKYREVQAIAKKVLSELGNHISSDSTEISIATSAKNLMAKYGVNDTWYHNVPALVLLGSRSCSSISGKDYAPSNEPVGISNLITVDLSPSIDHYWGDCARSLCMEDGSYSSSPQNEEFSDGLRTETKLHKMMIEFVTPETKFCDLYNFGNEQIQKFGYENLDFLSNLGHSIEIDLKDRMFIDKDCLEKLGSTRLFTFEPHIRKKGRPWGFKHENIYYFDVEGNAVEL